VTIVPIRRVLSATTAKKPLTTVNNATENSRNKCEDTYEK
jgi:hypothetical protein